MDSDDHWTHQATEELALPVGLHEVNLVHVHNVVGAPEANANYIEARKVGEEGSRWPDVSDPHLDELICATVLELKEHKLMV